MSKFKYLILSVLLLSSGVSYGATFSVEINYDLQGWAKKEISQLVQVFKKVNEMSVELSLKDVANEKSSPLDAFYCRIRTDDISTSNHGDVHIIATLDCEGSNSTALRDFDYKNFVEKILSRELGYQIMVSPELHPGSATVHN